MHHRRRVLLHEVILVEPLHLQLQQLQSGEADLEADVEVRLDYPHLDDQILRVEDYETNALWLFDERLALLLACYDIDVSLLLLVLPGFPVN